MNEMKMRDQYREEIEYTLGLKVDNQTDLLVNLCMKALGEGWNYAVYAIRADLADYYGRSGDDEIRKSVDALIEDAERRAKLAAFKQIKAEADEQIDILVDLIEEGYHQSE